MWNNIWGAIKRHFLFVFVLFFCFVSVQLFVFCFVFIINFHFLSKFIYVLFSFHSKICICVLFGKSLEVSPRGSSLTFPPHILYSLSVHNVGAQGGWVPLGGFLTIVKQHKPLVFRGLSLFQPHIFFLFLTLFLFSLPMSQIKKSKLHAN